MEFQELGDNRRIYIAWERDQAVGGVQLVLKRADDDPELANGATIAHVHHLRVRRDRQRRGLGRLLMLHAETEARSAGFSKLTLGVDNWNDNARALYKALGYAALKGDDYCTYLKKELR
jgi:ribosomal protein S18 acetylase RimI-like enzyme